MNLLFVVFWRCPRVAGWVTHFGSLRRVFWGGAEGNSAKREAASRKLVLGHFPALTPARARSKARAVLRTVAERRASGEDGARPVPTLRHALEGYLRGRPTVSANTRSQYRRRFERHAPQWLDRRLDELGRKDVERRFLALSEQAGPSVANAVVKLHRVPRRTIAPPAEVLPRWRRGLEAGVPQVMRDMVWMGLFTGLRISEVSGLKWEDIDASQSWLWIRETKNGQALELPITRQVRGLLDRRREAPDADDEWVFPGPAGRGPYTNAGEWYARISESAGSKFWFHGCRNAFITVAERDLMLPESLVKRLVNHAPSDDVTEGYAAEWTREELREASQRIAERVEALALGEPQGLPAAPTGCEGHDAR